MNEDDIEKQLRTLRQSPLPEAWRQEIISTALHRAKADRARPAWSFLPKFFRNLFLRNPATGFAFAAIWIAILFFKFITPFNPQDEAIQALHINSNQPIYMASISHEMELAELGTETEKASNPIP